MQAINISPIIIFFLTLQSMRLTQKSIQTDRLSQQCLQQDF
ncbi:hypothetical protein FKM82_017503 [Ascaphus truei]